MEKGSIHIIPVGFEYDRIVRPLFRFSVDEVILIRSSNVEFERQHELEDHFLKRLEEFPVKMRTISIDIYNFEEMFRTLIELIRDEAGRGLPVYINLSAAPKLEMIALLMAASMCRKGDVRLLYVKPEEYLQGKMMEQMRLASTEKPNDARETVKRASEEFMEKGLAYGMRELIELSPLPVEPSSGTEEDILQSLDEGQVDSLKELVERIRRTNGRTPRSNVVYHLESLKRKNLVSMEAGDGKRVQVRLTRTGRLFLEASKTGAG